MATIDITALEDGSTVDSTTVVSGTETSNVDALVRVHVDGVVTDVTTAADGHWSSTISLEWGTHEICAEKSDLTTVTYRPRLRCFRHPYRVSPRGL